MRANAVRRFGASAVLVTPAEASPLSLAAAIEASARPEVSEVVPAAATVLVAVRGPADVPDLTRWLENLAVTAGEPRDGQLVELDVVYDGEDLDEVAAATGLSVDEVIARHSAVTYDAAFCGFAPGFAYLAGLDPRLVLPRRATPRTRVPAGAVAIASTYSAVYPSASPGGWHLLGRTSAPLWEPARAQPALITPGTRARFRAVETTAAPSPVAATSPAAAMSPANGSLSVVTAGLSTTLQDDGRPGHAATGVTAAGALDRRRLALVNRLVGNPPSAAVLETAGGLVVEAVSAVVAASSASGAVTTLRPRARLAVDPAPGESWAYLAVRGGLAVEPVLGSRSRDTLGQVGPAPPDAGTILPIGPDPGTPITVDQAPPPPVPSVVDVHLGPRDDWFAAAAIEELLTSAWTITADRSRVGVRLDGPQLSRDDDAEGAELPSEGIVTGAIQVPHGGQPIVMLADHPTTGGYPVIAVVEPAGIPTVAQLPAGSQLRFRVAR